ncbi:MAG: hypothetical protein HKN70_15160, partial [Gammaproteobacteria bacterium]|nr:hypothetical protein [Gammaproteobacteria bacterium]
MPRDYKRSRTRKKKPATARPWFWSLGGFGIGLVVAILLMRSLEPGRTDNPVPDPQVTLQPQSSRDADTEPSKESDASATDRAAKRELLPPPGDEGFGFYDLLPNFDFVVADDSNESPAATPSSRRPDNAIKTPRTPGTYILQAGSFKKFADADRRKAELAFQGIESNIQQVVLGDEQIWYRVYVGPTKNLAQLEDHRSTL